MIFYDTQGNEISKKDFIELYNKIYFYLNDKRLEEQIEKIYLKGPDMTSEDLITLMRWKTGDKSHNDTEIITQYGAKISTANLITLLNEKNTSNDVNSLYDFFLEKKVKNIGSVYLLTIISAFTRGEYPIYDKYASIALTAIENKCEFRKRIPYSGLPDKTNRAQVIETYCDYISKLNCYFDEEWKTSRDIDRALWAYGHLFA